MTTRIIMRNDGRATAEGETEIFGTNGAQTVTILDGATVTFRSGFNTGGDTIRVNGLASNFTASITGSNVTLRSTVDNITVIIPIGSTANSIVFDNGDTRALSLVGSVPTLGAQTITAAGVAVTPGAGTFTITGVASANEGDTITYTVTRTSTTTAETLLFSVDGSTNGGVVVAATQGADFSPASGVVTFAAGAATATFTVAVSTDAAVEGLEGISVRVIQNGAVVASTNATIIDGQSQGQGSPLSAGVDTIVGTGGNDTITGRLSEFSSLDTVTGGAGTEDTLVLTGVLPADFQPQPGAVLDAAFERTTGIENLVLTGGTLAQSVDAVLGTLAVIAGLEEVIAGGTGGQAQTIDIQAFNDTLLVTGSGNAETVNVNLATAGAKTLNLGAGNDTVNVTPVNAVAGSVQVNFLSSAIGNGTNDTVTIVSANGNVTVNDESTAIQATNNASVFNVVGLAAAGGAADPAQDRGNFGRIELGTGAGEGFATDEFVTLSTYFNAGAGNDTFNVVAQTNERHFIVGGLGNDTLTAVLNDNTSRVVAVMGDGADAVIINVNNGIVDANLGDGDDSIRFNTSFSPNLVGATALRDVVNGGAGRDTLLATSGALSIINNTVVGAVQSVSGIEALTVIDTLNGNIITGLIQAGIDTVTLAAGTNGLTVTFDSGLASTLNLGTQVFNTIRVASAGTGTADQVTIANTAAALGGVAQNAFGGQAIVTSGVETLIVNTSAAGSATTQLINGISGTPAGRVNFVGGNTVAAGTIDARIVDASGLTGTAGIIAITTNVDNAANAFTGSAGSDTVTLGVGRQNLNLGAGNDTVVINAINALGTGTSRLNGGDGIDTLRLNTADAATLSVTNVFNANNTGFEVLSLNRQLQAPPGGQITETIRIDNIGADVNRVISVGTADGTPGLGSVETVTFNAVALQAGQTIVVSAGPDTVSFTAGANGATANDVATALRGLFNAVSVNPLVVEYAAGGAGAQVVLTGNTLANQGNVNININNSAAPVAPTITETTPGVAPVAAVAEVAAITLPIGIVPNGGADTFEIIGGGVATFTYSQAGLGPQTGQALANSIASQINAANAAGQIGQAFAATVVDAGGGVFRVQLTARAGFEGARPDLTLNAVTPAFNGATNLSVATTTQGANAIAPVNEVQTVTFNGLTQGQSVTVAGRTVTAVTGPLTASEVSDAFEQAVPVGGSVNLINGARIEGQVTNFTFAVSGGDAQTVLTATGPGNILSAPSSVAPAALPAVPVPTIVDGVLPGIIGQAGTLIIQNLDSNGTLEITGNSFGSHEVRVTDSGLNTSDVLNLELTNSSNGALLYGTVKVDNVERLNITTRDTGTNANVAATQDFIGFLDAAQATTVTVTGNNGLFIGGAHNMSALTTFNASGVVGNAGDLRAELGVNFQSRNNTVGATVTITGGIGNDDFISGAANDTFNLGSGGSDLVQFGVTRTANGQDTINAFTAGTGAGGDVLDLNGTGGVSVVDGNTSSATSIIFNATSANTSNPVDLVLTGNNTNVYLVTDGNATINLANIKDTTGDTALAGEILLTDGASAYVLHAASTGSNVFTVLRVFDSNGAVGIVDVRTEVLGTVNLTNTFADLTASNLDQFFTPVQTPLSAAEVAAVTPPAPAPMIGMLDNVGSFAIV